MAQAFRQTCPTCKIYFCAKDLDRCRKCADQARFNSEEAERAEEASRRRSTQQARPASPKPESKAPIHCSACLTTLGVMYVDRTSGLSTCSRCRVKHKRASTGPWYGWTSPRPPRNPDSIW